MHAPLTVQRAEPAGLVLCRVCGAVLREPRSLEPSRCPRCDQVLVRRPARSAERSLAWLIAGLICYVPANVLPVVHTSGVGGGQDSTILSGIISFWRAGALDIAALIFLASVAVPSGKFLVLGLLLRDRERGSPMERLTRARLYRVVELIGYWSMLDVVVIALTSALLQFKVLGTAEPRLGIVFFCAVVVATMLAAQSFDPRLVWDEERS